MQKTTGAVPVQELTKEEIEEIKKKFVRRVEYYSKKMGVTVDESPSAIREPDGEAAAQKEM